MGQPGPGAYAEMLPHRQAARDAGYSRPMTQPKTMQVPPAGLCFAVPVQLQSVQGAAQRRFSGIAYGGGVIRDHAWWDAVAFDLAGITAAAPMPLLLQHDQGAVIGVIDSVTNDGAQLAIAGKLFTGIDSAADGVAAKADAGAPWQMSVGIFPDRIEEINPGASAVVNGRQITGSAHVFRAARVREVSFVALGADGSTAANVFSQGAPAVAVPVFSTGDRSMSEQSIPPEALAAAVAERDAATARADGLAAELAALQAQFAARDAAERDAAVKALLGEEYSAEAAAPYLSMTSEQFAAVGKTFAALRGRLPSGFTAEQATGGQGGAPVLTPEAIQKYRRDNPGAGYEQAFAALTGTPAKTPAHF